MRSSLYLFLSKMRHKPITNFEQFVARVEQKAKELEEPEIHCTQCGRHMRYSKWKTARFRSVDGIPVEEKRTISCPGGFLWPMGDRHDHFEETRPIDHFNG